ncbi:MAG: 2-phosphosulfolactate phosphatase [Clostridiaceae bacterium]|nr:2-phosphosulfolactate phosphatase [Clostridiaceae bacterium]
MKINVFQLIEGAKKATGLTVVIDVFRAFTLACYAFANGAEDIIPVADLDEAYNIKKANPDYILMGERHYRMQKGFDYGNSPALIENVDFSGRTLIHTTSAGTQGIINAKGADEIITGSFVNAKAIAKYIMKKNPETLSLVCMGDEGIKENDEDNYCARYIISLLQNEPFDLEEMKEILKTGSGKRFFNPENSNWSPEGDFYLSMEFNRFDFVLRAEKRDDGLFHLKRILV